MPTRLGDEFRTGSAKHLNPEPAALHDGDDGGPGAQIVVDHANALPS